MDNKEIQRKRMMSYFLEATSKIIEEEGIEGVTIRKVASKAGFNSATLYNYFENLNHLLFFASLKYLQEYAEDLPNFVKDSKNSIVTYLKVWECFSYHSYLRPEKYNLIFFSGFSHSTINNSIKTYYSIFPEELKSESKEFIPMLLEDNIHQRDYKLLQTAVIEGFIESQHIYEINEMNVLIYQGMLSRILNKNNNCTVEEAVERTIKYIKRTLMSYGVDEKLFIG